MNKIELLKSTTQCLSWVREVFKALKMAHAVELPLVKREASLVVHQVIDLYTEAAISGLDIDLDVREETETLLETAEQLEALLYWNRRRIKTDAGNWVEF